MKKNENKGLLSILTLAAVLSLGIIGKARAELSYVYNDNKLSEISGFYNAKIKLYYDSDGNIERVTSSIAQCGGGWIEGEDNALVRNTDGTFSITSPAYNDYQAILDNKGKLMQDIEGSGAHYTEYTYNYNEATGEKISRTKVSCDYGNCSSGTTMNYTYDRDDDGNITKEYLNGQVVATRNYSEAYLAAHNCSASKSCTSCAGGKFLQGGECVSSCGASFRLNDGECDRIRYTPAEAAEVLRDGSDNQIIMTFKVNR
ncbi:MAG: hypothetical protein IKO06_06430 [Alphaproteobacteria bacterium]|nr:hypothetical protein [Alphaproteobacteria bacterium]